MLRGSTSMVSGTCMNFTLSCNYQQGKPQVSMMSLTLTLDPGYPSPGNLQIRELCPNLSSHSAPTIDSPIGNVILHASTRWVPAYRLPVSAEGDTAPLPLVIDRTSR